MTNEESNLEEGVPTSLSNGPGSLTPRQAKQPHKQHPSLTDAIKGVLKHG